MHTKCFVVYLHMHNNHAPALVLINGVTMKHHEMTAMGRRNKFMTKQYKENNNC